MGAPGWGPDAFEISARGTGKLYRGLRCNTVLEEPAGLPGAREGDFYVRRGAG